jgi:Cellulase (glycosyl hydrolase family 5)
MTNAARSMPWLVGNLDRNSGRKSALALRRSSGKAARTHKHDDTQWTEPLEPRQLLAADPITQNHPVFFAGYGSAQTDGVINAAEWAASTPISRAVPNQHNAAATVRYMFNERGLFVGIEVQDDKLWADGGGRGAGNIWDYADDDGVGLYFDASNTRLRFMPQTGRFLGMNLGRILGPRTGDGVVTRFDYLRGNGAGWGVNVNPGGALTPGMRWRTRLWGTANNNSDIDRGWSSEIFLPWATIGMTGMPANGQSIGTNFHVIFDSLGGRFDGENTSRSADPNIRFGPRVNDDDVQGAYSSLDKTWSGFRGPMNYAQLVFSNQFAADAPAAISNLSIDPSGYGARLNFIAPSASQTNTLPGASGGATAARYAIRIASSAIDSEDAWNSASVVTNTFVPKLAGLRESVRIGNLTPETTQHLAIRAVDAAGRLGPIVSQSFTTLSASNDPTAGERVIVSPAGGTLVTESGEPWIMIGSHAVVNTRYMRNAYPGWVWNASGRDFTNFAEFPGLEGSVDGYFDKLVEYGVNTLRVPLEWIALENSPEARSQLPNGMYWLEYPARTFNPAMRSYLETMMEQADRVGIKLILHPFGTFNYRTFFELSPYARVNGGPLDSMNQFYTNPEVLSMAGNRMRTIIDWVNESGNAHTIIGYEPINEWDSLTHGGGTQPATIPAQVNEMRRRARFLSALADQVRAHEPDALLIHSGVEVTPRGPVARSVFYSDTFDVLAPHWYTPTTSQSVNNPDRDKSVRAAVDYAGLAQGWVSQRRDNRPVHNGEWGQVGAGFPGGRVYYTGVSAQADPSKPWTVAEDVALYRATAWASLASGTAGPGLRLGSTEMRDLVPANISPETTGYLPLPLPLGMRQVQQQMSRIVNDAGVSIDWAHFDPTSLAGRMSFTGLTFSQSSRPVYGFGASDGSQGLAYVLKNGNVLTGAVVGAGMSISGLVAGDYVVEVWSGDPSVSTSVLSRFDSIASVNGVVSFALPSLAVDAVIKFKRIG